MAKKKNQKSGKINKKEVKNMEKVEQKDTVTLEDAFNVGKEEEVAKEEKVVKEEQLQKEVKEVKQEKSSSNVKSKVKMKTVPVEIRGKRIVKHVLGAVNITSTVIIPTDELPVASTNIVEIPLDKEYKDVKLLPPADITYELVSYYNGLLKIRPRINTVLKDKEINILVIE